MKEKPLQRGQFTFYASYLSSVEKLPKCRRYEVLLGIIRYALQGEEPDLEGASRGVFEAIRPHLDTGRRKAAAYLAKSSADPGFPPLPPPSGRM